MTLAGILRTINPGHCILNLSSFIKLFSDGCLLGTLQSTTIPKLYFRTGWVGLGLTQKIKLVENRPKIVLYTELAQVFWGNIPCVFCLYTYTVHY